MKVIPVLTSVPRAFFYAGKLDGSSPGT